MSCCCRDGLAQHHTSRAAEHDCTYTSGHLITLGEARCGEGRQRVLVLPSSPFLSIPPSISAAAIIDDIIANVVVYRITLPLYKVAYLPSTFSSPSKVFALCVHLHIYVSTG